MHIVCKPPAAISIRFPFFSQSPALRSRFAVNLKTDRIQETGRTGAQMTKRTIIIKEWRTIPQGTFSSSGALLWRAEAKR
jgi:hypothetical protein